MKAQKKITDSLAAESIIVAFDYQYYYFLYKVLTMKQGESVGLEVKDDVHTDLANNHQILVQVKHTTQGNAKGNAINLTTLDVDLWKTLSNWSKIISDSVDGRKETQDQLTFISKTDFLLVSNKTQTTKNEFLHVLEKPHDARKVIKEIRSTASGEQTLKHIDDVLNLNDKVLQAFMSHVNLELEVNEAIQKCKVALEEKQIDSAKIDELFRSLDSQIRQDNFVIIKNGEKVEISYQKFNAAYRRFFDIARNDRLIIRKSYKELPSNLCDQTFIRQLRDIGDIAEDDINTITIYTRRMLQVEANLELWVQKGELTPDEIAAFKEEAKIQWENVFNSVYRNGNENDGLALRVLDSIRQNILSINDQSLGAAFSNGEYYRQSDIPEIGWMKNWEALYK